MTESRILGDCKIASVDLGEVGFIVLSFCEVVVFVITLVRSLLFVTLAPLLVSLECDGKNICLWFSFKVKAIDSACLH